MRKGVAARSVLVFVMFVSLSSCWMAMVPADVTGLTYHDPIDIYGDAGFTSESGVVRGIGTPEDPFVIEGWEISGVGVSGAAVHVNNTNASFVIRDVVLISTGTGTGVLLEHLANGTLDNVGVSDFNQGISLMTSDDCTIVGCGVYNSLNEGVWLCDTLNVTVQQCTLVNNSYGIRTLDYRPDWMKSFSRNDIANNDYGIWSDSSFAEISNNSFSLNGVGLRYSGGYALVTQNLFSGSTSYAVMIVAGGPSSCIWNNTFVNNNGANETYDPLHIQGYDDGASTQWDSGGIGNYWSDWLSPDDNHDGVVDVPYDLADNPVHPVAGSDRYPLTTLTVVPEFMMLPFVTIVLLVTLFIASALRRRVG